MKTRQFGVLLPALILAAMVIVPLAGAIDPINEEQTNDLIESNYITQEAARDYSTIIMLDLIQSGALDKKWENAKILSDPQVIYDINGKKLFYLFSVYRNKEQIGEIYSAASKVHGSPVITIGSVAASIRENKLDNLVKRILNEKYKGYKLISEKKTCFDYPIIGLMIALQNGESGNEVTFIIDPRDGSEKQIGKSQLTVNPEVWSYYNQISRQEMIDRIKNFDKTDKNINTLKMALVAEKPDLLKNYSELDITEIKQIFSNARKCNPMTQSLLIQDGQKIISGLTHYTQYYNVWCGVATAKIISSKYGATYSQYHIATKMGAYYPDGSPKGATPAMELQYYTLARASGGLGKPSSFDIYRPYIT